MKTCEFCGREFNLTHAKRVIGRWYGAGAYDYYYPEGTACEDCATGVISCDVGTAEEIAELMGDSWYDD